MQICMKRISRHRKQFVFTDCVIKANQFYGSQSHVKDFEQKIQIVSTADNSRSKIVKSLFPSCNQLAYPLRSVSTHVEVNLCIIIDKIRCSMPSTQPCQWLVPSLFLFEINSCKILAKY